ncbi:MAG: metallophosphoesterase family protein [Lentisphaerae bacterium]|nr:metallophosphoesterase family protein [Lentisphaerota bacterium]
MSVQTITLDDRIERLIVVSDPHSFIEPLWAVERCLAASQAPFQVASTGDFLYGGLNPVEVVDWMRRHAGAFAVTGNHDEERPEHPGLESPPYTVAGALARLDVGQREYLRSLPPWVDILWRGRRIRLQHGHRTPAGREIHWTSRPSQLWNFLADAGVDLVVMGHTHFPFAENRNGRWLANAGSVSQLILGWKQADGRIVPQSDEPHFTSTSGIYNTYLSVTAPDGTLSPVVERFDYDRKAVIRRLHEAAFPHMDLKQLWIETGLFCF